MKFRISAQSLSLVFGLFEFLRRTIVMVFLNIDFFSYILCYVKYMNSTNPTQPYLATHLV